ncbi:MAG UNVERIFIED_CONTAM: hypothetical protein LVR18_02490 [Planctomycetaceae bacterium]
MDSPIVSTLPPGYQMDRQYGLIYDRIPARTDDLTRISGLHPREAAQLNKQGIFCFGQIALWRHREQVRFAEDLQVPFSRIVDEGWVSQARELCRERTRPAAGFSTGSFRTLTTLLCALLMGFLFVWLIANQQHAPLAGILIADVTQVKLPSGASVQHVHVRPGDEVFTGQKLLTLENSSLIAARVQQQKRVREAERTVQRLEARLLFEQETRRAEFGSGHFETAAGAVAAASGSQPRAIGKGCLRNPLLLRFIENPSAGRRRSAKWQARFKTSGRCDFECLRHLHVWHSQCSYCCRSQPGSDDRPWPHCSCQQSRSDGWYSGRGH